MTYRVITLWKLSKVTVEKISVCDSEVGAWVTCKISIWFIESPDHKQNHPNKKLKPTNKDCIGLKYKKQQLQK